MKNIFIDTDVIIDFLGNRASFSNAATELFDLYAHNNKNLLFLQILTRMCTIY